ncbi:unnamed protein product, partial [Scytosiphon promiscuus]
VSQRNDHTPRQEGATSALKGQCFQKPCRRSALLPNLIHTEKRHRYRSHANDTRFTPLRTIYSAQWSYGCTSQCLLTFGRRAVLLSPLLVSSIPVTSRFFGCEGGGRLLHALLPRDPSR